MKLVSWNVNGIRAIEKKGFASWLKKSDIDILAINETKAQSSQLSQELLDLRPYYSYWQSAQKKGYSGVCLYSKIKPDKTEALGVQEFDDEGRVLIAYYDDFVLLCAYFPNSQEKGARLDYKLRFCDAILDKMNNLVKDGYDVILCGDYNIAHKPIDLANPKQNEKNPGYLPEERAWMDKFLASGYCDVFRHFNPDLKDAYTWWSYRFKAREKNIGWRIDYFCTNKDFCKNVKSTQILNGTLGSDHCPVEIII